MYKIVAGFHTGFFVWEGKESIMQSTLLLGISSSPSQSLLYETLYSMAIN